MAKNLRKLALLQKDSLKEMEKHDVITDLSISPQGEYSYHNHFNLVDQLNIEGIDVKWISFSKYRVKIIYRGESQPSVFIESPKVKNECNHVYSNGAICLYHPNEFTWEPNMRIGKHIVPMLYIWIYYYEFWDKYGLWPGLEYPH